MPTLIEVVVSIRLNLLISDRSTYLGHQVFDLKWFVDGNLRIPANS